MVVFKEMGTQTTKRALNVYLSDISPHSQAILEFFIGSTGGKSFTLVSTPADAEVYITDFDYPGSKEHWEIQHTTSAKPCIALSIHNPENPYVEWVAKPITAKALIEAAARIADNLANDTDAKTNLGEETQDKVEVRDDLSSRFSMPAKLKQNTLKHKNRKLKTNKISPPLPKLSSKSSPFRQPVKMNTPAIHTRAPVFQQAGNKPSFIKEAKLDDNVGEEVGKKVKDNKPTVAKVKETHTELPSSTPSATRTRNKTRVHSSQQRWDLLCGEYKNVPSNALRGKEDLNFNPESYFLGTLIAGLRLAKQTKQVVQIKYAPHQFYVCYDEYLIFSPLAPDTDDYTELCYKAVKPGQVNLHILTSPESADFRKRIITDTDFTYDLESFIWTSSLLTSRGRVPSILDYDSKYLLKYWPNFTRIENFPYAMKVAARWQKKPYDIMEIANETSIPVRYVVAFVNGAFGLCLFETDTSIIQHKSTMKPAKKNGLIARLFGRLTRSEATG